MKGGEWSRRLQWGQSDETPLRRHLLGFGQLRRGFHFIIVRHRVSQHTGQSHELDGLVVITYAPYVAIIGLVVGGIIGAKRARRPK
jgi:hypothetical protein